MYSQQSSILNPNRRGLYVKAYQDNGMLDIQYWFYYPYHDDPGNDPHPHDWWYFWVVYDETDHKPYQVVYDFHHNLRAEYFYDSSRVERSGLHTKVYLDAGGHRCMFGPGEGLTDFFALRTNKRLEDDSIPGDQIFDLMIEGLIMKGIIDHSDEKSEIALWRYNDRVWNLGQTLSVEQDVNHWVWVYDVVQSYDTGIDKVSFTWSGEDIHNIEGVDSKDGVDTPLRNLWSTSGQLPWHSGYTTVDDTDSPYYGRYRSTTEMVWYWQQYMEYKNDATTPKSPTISTRYYDGSS